MTDEENITPDKPEDDLRFAPPADEDEAVNDVLSASDEAIEDEDSQSAEDDFQEPIEAEAAVDDIGIPMEALTSDESALPLAADEMDLDAALAAVSTLDDMLAEQEAAEQAEIARQQAEEDARVEADARLRNPEHFFAMPPMTLMQRGRADSVIPALVLILIGAWLTLSLTTGNVALDPALVILAAGGGLTVTLLARWLATGRWAMGALFFALAVLFTGGEFVFLLTQGGLTTRWPLLLIGPGLALFITGMFAGHNRVVLPAIMLIASSLLALLVTDGLLPDALLATLASAWPVAVIIIALLLILPFIFRQRQPE